MMSLHAPFIQSDAHLNALTPQDKIAILDCGAQYTKVIDRRVRELCIASEIFPVDVALSTLQAFQPKAIILSGGPHSVNDPTSPKCDEGIFGLGIPVLGICYGMQLMAQTLGGEVTSHHRCEYGETEITIDTQSIIFEDMAPQQHVLMSHGDSVTRLPEGFHPSGWSGKPHTPEAVLAAIEHPEKAFYAFQFHPEVELTVEGTTMLKHFLHKVAKLEGNFTLEGRLEQTLQAIRQQVGTQKVLVLVSGGVDSTVTAALLLKALTPEQVFAVHVDSGFMRHEESASVVEALKSLGLKYLKHLDATEQFLNARADMDGNGVWSEPLKSVTDPETKRRIIGDTFVAIVNEVVRELFESHQIPAEDILLAQGTLRPDLIESGNRDISQTAHVIKTHHNDVPLIQALREQGRVIEPNRDLHKDEVRQIGKLLGLSDALVYRQPFPGPGLAIRMLCTQEPVGLDTYDDYHTALQTLLKTLQDAHPSLGLHASLAPIRSVGVQGDGRSYRHLVLLSVKDQAVLQESSTWETLRQVSQHLTNQLSFVNRVAVCLSHPALPDVLKQVTPLLLQPTITAILRRADYQVTQVLSSASTNPLAISQLLSVLLPIAPSDPTSRKYALAIRAVVTSDFMTARAARVGTDPKAELHPDTLLSLAQRLLSTQPELDSIFYDITGKPPATVEWE
ncbi:MAG: glutamine-hydrolyzing GMP synthase [Vampirovibrionales bacterium]